MNTLKYLVSFVLLLASFHLSAQTTSQRPLPSEFTEKGASSVMKKRIRPFKRVVYFDIDNTDLNRKAKGILDNLFKVVDANPQLSVRISGHSNGSCDSEYCQGLSNTRAETVAFYLMEKGVKPLRLQYNGYGKQKPVASNRTTSGKQRNQRVEIRVY